MTLYFAYGSNMDLMQMSNRCELAATVGIARLASYRFIINSHGVATVVPDPASAVEGLLWRITDADERSLDHYEGVRQGVYRKAFVELETPDGRKIKALIYIAVDRVPGVPRPGYLEKIISAAEACGLPGAYVDQLKPWLP
jgi:gamma-glutamylcyclotransferase (GGCT)/AIG2-like uncharacterized protein YtfP